MGVTPRRRRTWLAIVGVVLIAGGLVAHYTQGSDAGVGETAAAEPTTPTPSATAGTAVVPAPTMSAAPRETKRPDVRRPRVTGVPGTVVIPALEVDAPVLPIQAPGGVLIPPGDPQELGWWADGAMPGAARGSALVTGHTVHTGGGALDDLETLGRGDLVKVRTSGGWIDYAVRDVEVYDKGSLATGAPHLFSQESRGRLVLITCEDWNGERYLSNVVVTAFPRA